MIPVFSTPLALIGLIFLPALTAIYYLHTRSRLHPVSSLLLWTDVRISPDGGRRVDQPRLPLVFWLELLTLALLVLAASGVHLPSATGARPLIVVLDDSFSMQAGAPDSARKRAADALLDSLKSTPRHSVRLVLAGDRPQILGESVTRTDEVAHLLEDWKCTASAPRLDSALALALELGGDSAVILVLTDRAPDPPPAAGRVRWWSFGKSLPNWAFVNASRTTGPHGDRLLLEVANLATEPRSTILRIETGQPPQELRRSELHLNAGETQRTVLELPAGAGPIRAFVDDDALNFDNSVALLPAVRKSATYKIQVGDGELRSVLERAAKATGIATTAEAQPQLLFVEGQATVPDNESTWIVRLIREPEAEAFTGPFVLDRSHPLTDGLALDGVVWGGGKSPLPGIPVLMAGNVPLITDTENPNGRHEIRLRLRPDLSNLTQSPAWPSLVLNLMAWRGKFQPGLDRTNLRLGEEAVWTLPTSSASVTATLPSGAVTTVPVHQRRATIRAAQVGVYSLHAGEDKVEFAVNALNRDISDLTKCTTGRWGDELDEATLQSDYRDITSWLVLLAAAVATVHVWLLARKSSTGAIA